MALSNTAICDVQNLGSDSFAGYFNPSNANFSTDLAATSATGASPVVTSASYTFVAGDVGKYLWVLAGTNWIKGRYPIASVSAGAATLNAAVGAVITWDSTNSRLGAPNTTAGCASTASPTSGTWGVDYSQGTAAGVAFTDMVIDGTTNTKFTSAANPVGKNMIGNGVNVLSGTGFTVQMVEIVSTSTITATCDKSLGTLSSTGGTGNLGGSFATPGGAAAKVGTAVGGGNLAVLYNAAVFAMSASTNVASGSLSGQVFANIFGWATNRWQGNQDANRPTFQASANSVTCINNNELRHVNNIIFDANSKTGFQAVAASASVADCVITNCATIGGGATGFVVGDGSFINSTSDATTTAFQATLGYGYKCTATGGGKFRITNRGSWYGCNASGGSYFQSDGITMFMANCNMSSPTTQGIGGASGSVIVAVNCVIWNTTTGVAPGSSGTGGMSFINCAIGSVTTAYSTFCSAGDIINPITLTAIPWTNAAGGDFSLNNTAGGGALLRELGYPSTLPGLSTNDYSDVNAVQRSVASAAGALMYHPGMSGGTV